MKWMEQEKDNLLSDLKELIRIPSVSREDAGDGYPFGKPCALVLDKILEIGSRLGFSGENHDNYCASILWRGEMEEEIGIFAHLDVVPEGNGWKYSPYEPVVEDGLIIGRGASDNKGPAMAVLYALKYLKDHGFQPKHSIRMFFGTNEECGMKDIKYYVERYPMPVFSFTPDAAFPVCHGEKGVMELEISCPLEDSVLKDFHSGVASNSVPSEAYGILLLTLEEAKKGLSDSVCDLKEMEDSVKVSVRGIAAHAAFPEGSDSAEVKLAGVLLKSGLLDKKGEKVMRAVSELFSDYYGFGMGIPYSDEISGKLTHVGGMARMKDGRFCQNINIRYPVTTDREIMAGAIRRRMGEMGFGIDAIRDSAPCYMDASAPEVKLLTKISNEYLGMDAAPYVMGGGTYARKLKNAVGFGPGIPGEESAFGPDRGKGHQPDEYTRIDKLFLSLEIYTEAVRRLDEIV